MNGLARGGGRVGGVEGRLGRGMKGSKKGNKIANIPVLTVKILFHLVDSFEALVHYVVELLQVNRGKTTSLSDVMT